MKTYSYDEALNASLNYFNGDDLAAKVFLDKYALKNISGELLELTPDDMHNRLANEFARIEAKKFKEPLSKDIIYSLFKNFKYIVPQGSPMFGIGNNHQIISLSNCYVLDPPLDSYSSILKVDEQLVNISKRRGGVGIDLSNLRPAGTITNNAARSSTGIASWMERYSNSIREVGQGGRRGALMLTLSIHHPDIIAFCTIKNDSTKVTGANISVRLSKEFLDALKKDKEYELRWPEENPVIRKKIRAKDVWDVIIDSAHNRAEPGLLMWDNILKCPADCYPNYQSRSTNPCSEINLSPLDSCRLLAMNLLNYVRDPFTANAQFDSLRFYEDAQIAQRLMDDLVDLESEKIQQIINKINNDPEPIEIRQTEIDLWKRIKRFNDEGRRTGLGITALGDTLAALNIQYGSQLSIEMTGYIYKCLKFGAYRSSVDMAKELGHFKDWDPKLEKENEFLNRIGEENLFINDNINISGKAIFDEMNKVGRRNIALLTTAPTGSVSIETQTTSGIEPLFMIGYTRRKKINPNDQNTKVDFKDQNGDCWQEFTVYHPTVKKWMAVTGETDVNKSPWYGACASDINWVNRVKLQAAAQSHVCHAISSTINLPENVSKEEVSEIYQEAFSGGCKGMTIYRDNCRTGVLVNKATVVKEGIQYNEAPKRPTDLDCDVHHINVSGQPYFVLVGKLNDQPYEVFAGKNNCVERNISKGQIHKLNRPKCYRAEFEDGTIIQPITVACDHNEESLTRMVSTALRHGAEIKFIVEQLTKTQGDMTSFAKALSRALKTYIKDGTKTKGKCDSCGSESLTYSEGCKTCMSCGWSKCS